MKPCRVPADIVVPVLQRVLDTYETRGWSHDDQGNPPLPALAASRVIAERAGMLPDTLVKILMGRSETMSFYDVDRLLCALDAPMLWYEWPLLPFYLAADLSVPPPGYLECAREGCVREFAGDGEKKYCSKTCRRAANLHRRGTMPRNVKCRNGHDRPPDYDGHGKPGRYCRECERDNQRRYRNIRKQHLYHMKKLEEQAAAA